MKTTTRINIEEDSRYVLTDMVNIFYFDPNLLNIHEIAFRDEKLTLHDISYLKKQNTFYVVFNNLDGIFRKSGYNK